jgi:hypothetical protein
MTNGQAVKQLQDFIVYEQGARRKDLLEALHIAIKALRNPMLDHKKVGAMGGKATFGKYGRKEMARRGKLGGRPSLR